MLSNTDIISICEGFFNEKYLKNDVKVFNDYRYKKVNARYDITGYKWGISFEVDREYIEKDILSLLDRGFNNNLNRIAEETIIEVSNLYYDMYITYDKMNIYIDTIKKLDFNQILYIKQVIIKIKGGNNNEMC